MTPTAGTSPTAGGWNNAGDERKWLAFTMLSAEALVELARRGSPGFRAQALEEIRWGNEYFHWMIDDDGQVYEDVGAGAITPELAHLSWWFENHPGVLANNEGSRGTDNVPRSGDDRSIRTSYNPWVQLLFVRVQSLVGALGETAGVPRDLHAVRSQALALRGWEHARRRGHDGRTLFVAAELRAALELHALTEAGVSPEVVSSDDLEERCQTLLGRQDRPGDGAGGSGGLSGYFLESDAPDSDAYRSIAFACEPAMALVRLLEVEPPGLARRRDEVVAAVTRYVDDYLLADAASNPYGLPPYGVYLDPPNPDRQTFRDAGRGRGVRTFLPPWNEQFLSHGINSVAMHSAALLARAGAVLDRDDWRAAAERTLSWALGHNPASMSLFVGIGHHHAVQFSTSVHQVPEAASAGFIGRPDDTPYIEQSRAMEWSTQEIWDVPYAYAVLASLWLMPPAPAR